jgi:hypothetical protein
MRARPRAAPASGQTSHDYVNGEGHSRRCGWRGRLIFETGPGAFGAAAVVVCMPLDVDDKTLSSAAGGSLVPPIVHLRC